MIDRLGMEEGAFTQDHRSSNPEMKPIMSRFCWQQIISEC